MRITRTVLIPIATGILGLILGGFIATRYWLQQSANLSALRNQASAQEHIRALRQVRKDNQKELAEEFEALLDGDIISLGYSLDTSKEHSLGIKHTLASANRYRRDFPHSAPYPEINQAVTQALKKAAP